MKKTYLLLFIISLILFIIGIYTYGLFFHFTLPNDGNLKILDTSLNDHFKNHVFFSIFLGLLPTSLYLTWKLGRIDNNAKRILTTFIVLISIGIALSIRLYMVHLATRFIISDNILNTTTIENLKYIQFMFGGLFFGIIFSWIFFRKKTMR